MQIWTNTRNTLSLPHLRSLVHFLEKLWAVLTYIYPIIPN